MTNTRLKLIIIVVVILTVLGLASAGYSAITNSPKTATLKISVAPTGATLKLNGKGVKAGTIRVRPGEYTLKASKQGFTEQSLKTTVKAGDTRLLGAILQPSSDTTKDWYKTHKQDAYLAEGISSQIDQQANTDAAVNDPFLVQLPVSISPLFTITSGQSVKFPNDATKTALFISTKDPSGKNGALSYIYALGGDPSDYEIIFKATSTAEDTRSVNDDNEQSEDALYPDNFSWEDVAP